MEVFLYDLLKCAERVEKYMITNPDPSVCLSVSLSSNIEYHLNVLCEQIPHSCPRPCVYIGLRSTVFYLLDGRYVHKDLSHSNTSQCLEIPVAHRFTSDFLHVFHHGLL